MFVPYLLLSFLYLLLIRKKKKKTKFSLFSICSTSFKLVSLSLDSNYKQYLGRLKFKRKSLDWEGVYILVNVSSVLKSGSPVLHFNIITFNLYLLVAVEFIRANNSYTFFLVLL